MRKTWLLLTCGSFFFKACRGFCCLLCDYSETINGTILIQRWVVPSLNTMALFKDSHTINECMNYFSLFLWIKANGKHQNKWCVCATRWSLMWIFYSCIVNSLIKGLMFSLLQRPKKSKEGEVALGWSSVEGCTNLPDPIKRNWNILVCYCWNGHNLVWAFVHKFSAHDLFESHQSICPCYPSTNSFLHRSICPPSPFTLRSMSLGQRLQN